jgi:putative ABC transport system permease protein
MPTFTGAPALLGGYLRSNLGRSCYLVMTVAIISAVLLGLAALATPAPVRTRGDIYVVSARDGMLPLRYVDSIQALPGVVATYYSTYLPLECASGGTATLNAYGGAGVRAMMADDYAISPGIWAAWNANPLGILIGERLAAQCGWKQGMHLTPLDGFRNQPVDIDIVGLIHATNDAPFANQIAFAHYDYLNRLAPDIQRNQVAGIGVRTRKNMDRARLTAVIDSRFAHSDPPTDTHQWSSADDSLRRFGNIQALLWSVMAAMAGCLTLVVASLLAHAALERRRQFAVLRVLGFHRRFIGALFAAEFTLLIGTGLVLGYASGLALIAALAPSVSMLIGALVLPPTMRIVLPLILLAVLAVSLLLPVLAIAQTRATDVRST